MPAGDNPRYNNCFTLGAKCWEKGKLIKIPVYIDHWDDTIQWLFGSKKGNKRKDYELSYEEARTEYSRFWSSENWETSGKDLRVSLWLDNAMFGNLHIFVIDFDKIDGTVETESAFFKAAKELADKVTRSQGGGYHMFYGVDKQKAEPLFDSINLLASENAASFVCKTGAVTRDGANKVDLFCDTGHFIYEWDNAAGLTDKTQEVYQLIKENFDLSRPMSSGNGKRASGKGGKSYAMLEELSEEELLQQMSTEQREVFANLEKTKSPHWKQNRWLSVGIDIFHVFGADLGGKVFLYWSKPGKTFQPQSCANTWDYICEIAPDSELWDSHWADIMRGTQTGLNRAEEEPSQSAASQVPLPLEEDTSAALEETAAEPTFRDLPIAWENVTTEENGKQRTGHWIVWNGNRSKREEFFKLAFPDQYNKVKKRVKFLGQAADDVLRLTGGQRTKLMYEILAWKYGLEEVSEQDSLDLIRLCQREEDNKTADDLLSRLYWPSGLAKLVTFGVGMKLDAAAQHTWCYSVDYQEDRALFTGSSITWERWQE